MPLPVANAAQLTLTPTSHTLNGAMTGVSTANTAGHANLTLSFEHTAANLEDFSSTGDSLQYGWRISGSANNQLGVIEGKTDTGGQPGVGENGSKSVALPAAAAVQNLEIYFTNTGSSNNSVVVSNIALNGAVPAPVCDYDFDAQKMWEVTWGYGFEDRNGGAAKFTQQSNGGMTTYNGRPLPQYMASDPSFRWLYVSDNGAANAPYQRTYGFADGTVWTVNVTWSTVNECQVPTIVWTTQAPLPPEQVTKRVEASGEHNWIFNRDVLTSSPYEFSDMAASDGTSSLFVKPIGTNPADKFIAENFTVMPVSVLNSIAYDFKIAGNGTAADANDFYLNVYANIDNSTNYYDCRFDYVPMIGSTSSFTTATFAKEDSPVNVQKRGNRISSCPATLAGMPAGSHVRAFAISLGDTSSGDTGLAGYFDKVVTSTNTEITTYNFELKPYVNNPSGSNFIGTDKYVRAGSTSDVAAAVRVPAQASEVRFNFDGTTDVNGVVASEHLQPSQWPNAAGDKQFRVNPLLSNGAYGVTAEYKVGNAWFPVTGGATAYAIDMPTASYVLPQPNQTFRPNDNVVRVRADDEFNQFSKMVVRINSVNYEVQRAACSDKGNYVLCDVVNANLPAGRYTATTTTYTKASNRVDNLVSPTFYVDAERPKVSSFVVENAGEGVVAGTMIVSAKATDDRDVESVNFYVTNPRDDGQCTGNGTVLISQRVQSTANDGKYRVTLNTSELNGNYCVTAVSRDAAFSNSSLVHQKITIDNQNPSVPEVIVPVANQQIPAGTSSITNSWTPSTDPNGVKQYEIRYVLVNNANQVSKRTVNAPATSRTQTFSGSYTGPIIISVRAQDNAGNWSGYGDEVTYYYGVSVPADPSEGDGDGEEGTGTSNDNGSENSNTGGNIDSTTARGTTNGRSNLLASRAPVFAPAFITAVNQGTPATQSESQESDTTDDGDILGTSATENDDDGQVAGASDKAGWSIGDMAWYWWLLIVAGAIGAWLIIAAISRRLRDRDA